MTPCIMALKNSDFLTGAYIIEHSPVLIVPVNNNKHKKDTVIPNLLSFLHMQKISENKLPTTFPLLLLMSVKLQVNLQVSLCTVTIECFHMTSRRPYWCPKTMKRRPCWCPKPVPWELNCFLMQTLYFVTMNLHICWPLEWKHSVKTWWRLRVVKKSNKRKTTKIALSFQLSKADSGTCIKN